MMIWNTPASAIPWSLATPAVDGIVSVSDGRRIAVHCAGSGRFTVLLEPGDGGRRRHMARLFAALSARYRVAGSSTARRRRRCPMSS